MKIVTNETQPYALEESAGEAIWYANSRATMKVTSVESGGAFSLIEMLLEPDHSPPLHIHRAEDESFWVLDGRLTFRAGDRTLSAGPGSFVYTPRGVAHTFKVDSSDPARLLVLFVPGGMEQFFVEAGRAAEGEGLPDPQAPDVAHMAAIAPKYHMEFVGPPLAASGTTVES